LECDDDVYVFNSLSV